MIITGMCRAVVRNILLSGKEMPRHGLRIDCYPILPVVVFGRHGS